MNTNIEPYSNTTNVKVKHRPEIPNKVFHLRIQIQPMLRLNPSRCALWQILIIIQIQPMLRLNYLHMGCRYRCYSHSNTTNVKVKHRHKI